MIRDRVTNVYANNYALYSKSLLLLTIIALVSCCTSSTTVYATEQNQSITEEDIMRYEKSDVILDTDIGPDCDDAAALALAIVYGRMYDLQLLAIMHCTSSPWGVGAIRSILQWYNALEIPVGTLMDEGFLVGDSMEIYNKHLAQMIGSEERMAPDAVQLYRKILSQRPDRSVQIITVGPLRNLANLLRSMPDENSPLCGIDLVRKKIVRLTLMGGRFDYGVDRPEWNVEMDIDSARLVAEEWPGQIFYCGYEVGENVIALSEPNKLDAVNPVRLAYRLHTKGVGRPSWDLCTVQWALDSDCDYYVESKPGTITIDEYGITSWRESLEGQHHYITMNSSPIVVASNFETVLGGYDAKRNDNTQQISREP